MRGRKLGLLLAASLLLGTMTGLSAKTEAYAAETVTQTVTVEVPEEPLVSANLNQEPEGELNPELFTVGSKAVVVGDSAYLLAVYDGAVWPAFRAYCNGDYYGYYTSTYTGEVLIPIPAFEGSKSVKVAYVSGSDFVAYKDVTVTAVTYEEMLANTHYTYPVNGSRLSVNYYVPGVTEQDIQTVGIYDGDTVFGVLETSWSTNSNIGIACSEWEEFRDRTGTVYLPEQAQYVSGYMNMARKLTDGKTYTLKAVLTNGTSVTLGIVEAGNKPFISYAGGTSSYASNKPVISVSHAGATANQLVVELLAQDGKVLATSAGGQAAAAYTESSVYELATELSRDELRGSIIKVSDRNGNELYRKSTYYFTPGIAGVYYSYPEQAAILITSGLPDGTVINASVDGAYTASGEVSDNRVTLRFLLGGQQVGLPSGSVSIACTYTRPAEETETTSNGYVYVYGDSSSYMYANPAYVKSGTTSQEFRITLYKDGIIENLSGDFTAQLKSADGVVTGVFGPLTVEEQTWSYSDGTKRDVYVLTGTWTGDALAANTEYSLEVTRAGQSVGIYYIDAYDAGKILASLYAGTERGGAVPYHYVEIYAPAGIAENYDFNKFQISVTDALGNSVNVGLKKLEDRSYTNAIYYQLTNIPEDLVSVNMKVTYEGQPVYSYYDSERLSTATLSLLSTGFFTTYGYTSSKYPGYQVESMYADQSGTVQIREAGTMALLKSFNIGAGETYLTEEMLSGLNYNNMAVSYLISYISDNGLYQSANSGYLGVRANAGGSSSTPTPPQVDEETIAQVHDFVARMYTVALGRDYEIEGLNDWSTQLLTHKADGAGIARGFFLSTEFVAKDLSNEDFVDTLYRTLFGREADEGGRQNWLDALASGQSREFVLAGFVNSQEFDDLCESYGIARGILGEDGNAVNPGIRQFVERMYTKALNRNGEKAGIDDWVNRLVTGQETPEVVARNFFLSQELTNQQLSNQEYVLRLYRAFFDREPENGENQGWIGALDSGELNREQIIGGFSGSEEFRILLVSYGL